MPAPRVKPLNPDAQILLDTLLNNPDKAVCPICDGVGFWDNRDDPKRPEKAPHWKCKNKDCPGATPLKGKRPYGVWLPDNYVEAPPPSGKRVPSPFNPPGHPTDAPPPDDAPEGTVEAPATSEPYSWEPDYLALAERVAAFQARIGEQYQAPFDLASINAMTFSIWHDKR